MANAPHVPSIGAPTQVADPAARRVLQPLIDTHNARNGVTDQRFVTAAELREATSALSITPTGAPATGAKTSTGQFVQVAIGGETYYLELFK